MVENWKEPSRRTVLQSIGLGTLAGAVAERTGANKLPAHSDLYAPSKTVDYEQGRPSRPAWVQADVTYKIGTNGPWPEKYLMYNSLAYFGTGWDGDKGDNGRWIHRFVLSGACVGAYEGDTTDPFLYEDINDQRFIVETERDGIGISPVYADESMGFLDPAAFKDELLEEFDEEELAGDIITEDLNVDDIDFDERFDDVEDEAEDVLPGDAIVSGVVGGISIGLGLVLATPKALGLSVGLLINDVLSELDDGTERDIANEGFGYDNSMSDSVAGHSVAFDVEVDPNVSNPTFSVTSEFQLGHTYEGPVQEIHLDSLGHPLENDANDPYLPELVGSNCASTSILGAVRYHATDPPGVFPDDRYQTDVRSPPSGNKRMAVIEPTEAAIVDDEHEFALLTNEPPVGWHVERPGGHGCNAIISEDEPYEYAFTDPGSATVTTLPASNQSVREPYSVTLDVYEDEDDVGPTAHIDGPTEVDADDHVTFDGSGSSSSGEITEYYWTVQQQSDAGSKSDGNFSSTGSVGHGETLTDSFDAGFWEAELQVTDSAGHVDTTTHTFEAVDDDDDGGEFPEVTFVDATPSLLRPGEPTDFIMDADGEYGALELETRYCGTTCEEHELVDRWETHWKEDVSYEETGLYQLFGTAWEDTDDDQVSGDRDEFYFYIAEEDSDMFPDPVIDGPTTVDAGEEVTFDASDSSFDHDNGEILNEYWWYVDGKLESPFGPETFTTSFDEPGPHTVEVGIRGEIAPNDDEANSIVSGLHRTEFEVNVEGFEPTLSASDTDVWRGSTVTFESNVPENTELVWLTVGGQEVDPESVDGTEVTFEVTMTETGTVEAEAHAIVDDTTYASDSVEIQVSELAVDLSASETETELGTPVTFTATTDEDVTVDEWILTAGDDEYSPSSIVDSPPEATFEATFGSTGTVEATAIATIGGAQVESDPVAIDVTPADLSLSASETEVGIDETVTFTAEFDTAIDVEEWQLSVDSTVYEPDTTDETSATFEVTLSEAGQIEVVATAMFENGSTQSGPVDVSVMPVSGIHVEDAEITTDQRFGETVVEGTVTLANETDSTSELTVSLEAEPSDIGPIGILGSMGRQANSDAVETVLEIPPNDSAELAEPLVLRLFEDAYVTLLVDDVPLEEQHVKVLG